MTHNGVLRALLALATGWDMLGKPPVKLRPATMHRFMVEAGPAADGPRLQRAAVARRSAGSARRGRHPA